MSNEIRRSERIKNQRRINYKTFKMVSDSEDDLNIENKAPSDKAVSENKNTEDKLKINDETSGRKVCSENKDYGGTSKKEDGTTQDEKIPETKSIICEGENKVSEAESNFFLMIEEIEDYIDEFPINRTTISIEDIETCTEKISQLRTKFRMVIKNLTRVVSASKFDPSVLIIKE